MQKNFKTLDGKVEVRIENNVHDSRAVLAIRVNGEEVLALEVSAEMQLRGAHEYSDGFNMAVLKIEQK